mgnify:CR=1 FL=1
MPERPPPQHRTALDDAPLLIKHLEFKMENLSRYAEVYKLGQDAVEFLRGHIQQEIDDLKAVKVDTPRGSLWERHYANMDAFNEKVGR